MRIKTCYVCFFKESLNKRAENLILELNETIVYILVNFKYWSFSFKNLQDFQCIIRKKDTLLSWKSSLCRNVASLEEEKQLIFLLKNLKHNQQPDGGKKYELDDDDGDDDDGDDEDDDIFFTHIFFQVLIISSSDLLIRGDFMLLFHFFVVCKKLAL